MRDWIYIVTLDENQNYSHAESFMPNSEFSHPMDMFFGTDGKMYVLEYGQKWNVRNIDARLCRINYIKGNRPPLAKIDSDKEVGALTLTIQFSAKESKDYDNDIEEYMISNMGKGEFEKLLFWWGKNVQESIVNEDEMKRQ